MRRIKLALCISVAAIGCGDNLVPDLVVTTRVPKPTFAAGERIDARCAVLDYTGEPALDAQGNALTDTTTLTIDYRHPDSFTTDDEGQVIAKRVGEAIVRCAAPDLDLIDEDGQTITIVAGPATRVVTVLSDDTAIAGTSVGVGCIAFDAFGNPVGEVEHTLAMTPTSPGSVVTTDTVAANIIGEYEVTCVVPAAADVVPDQLVVLAALPASLIGSLVPERSLYAIDEQVTLVAEAHDEFGNRVDDAAFGYSSAPTVPSPSDARFRFDTDGTFFLTAAVTSPTFMDIPLSVTLPVNVDSAGPAIQCMQINAQSTSSEAYMIQLGPSTVAFPARINDAFGVQTVTIGGQPATLNTSTGNFEAPVPIQFGMNFVDVIATDSNGKENSTTCFVLAGEFFTPEADLMGGALALRLDPDAVGDPTPSTTPLNSLNDIFFTVLRSPALRDLIDQGLVAANPLNDGSCGLFACNPDVNYQAGSLTYDPPTTTLSLIPGGLRAQVTFPNDRMVVRACGTACCPGGSNITVTVNTISATVDFNLSLQGGVMRAAVAGSPTVTVGSVSLSGSGFCGFVVNLIQGLFTNTIRNAVRNALTNFINSNVGPMLDQLVSGLDVSTLGASFDVPKLDGSGTVQLGFGLNMSSLDITTGRFLLGMGTRFTPGAAAHNRQSLGIARRTPNPLLDPPGTSSARPVGISFYEGVLNQVLHGLWRGGFFQGTINIGGGTATIDGRLPAVAQINANNTAQLMLGGIAATITIPGVINQPIPVLFGGRASAAVSLVGDTLSFGNFTLDTLFVSFQTPLTQSQRQAMADFLADVLRDVLSDAINEGLPAFPIPSFTLPASVANFGLPAGAELGILTPQLATSGTHYVLTGSFGVR